MLNCWCGTVAVRSACAYLSCKFSVWRRVVLNCRHTIVFARAHFFSVPCVMYPVPDLCPSIRTELHVPFWGSFAVLLYAFVVQVKVYCRWTVCCYQFSVELLTSFRPFVLILSVSVCLASTSCSSHKSPCSFSINPTWGAQQRPRGISCPRGVTNAKLVTWIQMTHWHRHCRRHAVRHTECCAVQTTPHSLPY